MKLKDLTPGEWGRLRYGRTDWREHAWQDHCGDPNCENCSGLIPDPNPAALSMEDKRLRAALIQKEARCAA